LTHAVDPFLSTLALVGVVIIISALLSGLIERSGVPQVAVLLGLGAVLGPYGLGLLHIGLDSPVLRAVAILSLALVLFTDALSLSITEIRRHKRLTLLVVGPGTLLSAAMVTLAAKGILGLSWPLSAILGAALASTDPVLLRGVIRWPDLPASARLALRLESGLNDIVLLPVVLVAMVFLSATPHMQAAGWARMGLTLFLLGPGAGLGVGLLGVATLDLIRRRVGVRRDYESLYSLGLAFAAYAAAESLGGSGFLAAFTAGFTISILDVELCDCFKEYGETTAELSLLFTFVVLGSSLIWTGFSVANGSTLLFAFIVLLVRPVAFLLSLAPTRLDRRSMALIAWFGPRGLSSLLLVLLPVFAGLGGSKELFSICCLVVLLSVLLHGGSVMWLGRRPAGADGVAPPGPPPAAPLPLVPLNLPPAREERSAGETVVPEAVSIQELQALQESGSPVVVLDVRTQRSWEDSESTAQGSVRVDPERTVREAERLQLPKEAWLVAFCA
jgi:sodium/hydrogen antiporter